MKTTKPRLRLKLIWKVILSILLLEGIIFIILGFFSKRNLKIELNGDNPFYVEYGTAFQDPGARAYLYPSGLPFIHVKADVKETDNVDSSTPGTYKAVYTASRRSFHSSLDRTVIVRDTVSPVITLTSDPSHYTLPGHPYEEEGYTAVDNCDGDISDKVVSHEENGTVYYSVSDHSGNIGRAERKIIYDDRLPPVISLNGGSDVIWYTDAGAYVDSYTAVDDLDGDVTKNVQITGHADTSKPGDYTLHYSVTDSYGNTAEADRTVHVQNRPVHSRSANESASTIYLTFDDGPGPYTDKLLAVLAKYNVKASFFTASAKPQYAGEIAKEAAAGHTVAVHTYSHQYSNVYSSTEAYWADFDKQNAVIKNQTGSYTTFFRFPGGSSNTVSRDYCSGIMSALVNEAGQLGYSYFDWNVSSGDAGETTSSDQVFANVTSQVIKNHNAGCPSVVLQHDIKEFSVNAVERIIIWGLQNGYDFQPLTSSSYKAHHHVNN